MSITTISVYGATPTSISDVYTIQKNDDYIIYDFDENQTYYRQYILYNDGSEFETDEWSYGQSIEYRVYEYMDSSKLYIYPMSGSNERPFILPISDTDEPIYYDVNLQFDVSSITEIFVYDLTLYIAYFGDNGLIDRDSITYNLEGDGFDIADENQFVCPAGTTGIRLSLELSLDGDSVSGTNLISDFRLNKFQLKFNEQEKGALMTVTNIITAIVEGATGILSGIGAGAVSFFESIFLNTEGGLSALGTYLLVFVGVGMAIGIMRWIRSKVG